ncbi:uncharacterized protein MKK02DRAFT_41621 [Dioszegia hungarica]|uniref:Nucleolar protein 12 n=1 Tax=Dioszegia hungarica TaxID=4972 RepID=A0AA38LQJ4_9TREE|nr:uncharacterized protein MKK02DRAFT_41621 [Dioszegia hungarica]KAI9631980.1 hypothetical protein MKK02DRAFT_41621 [Dioszegia hungarica]
MATALSKKQQKALLFRQKQKAKKTGEAIPGDVPEEDVEPGDDDDAAIALKKGDTAGESSATGAGKKRKRAVEEKEEEAEDLTDGLKGKVKNVGKGKGKAWEDEGEDGERSAKKSKKEIKQRFILFLGNLGFKTTVPEIQAHFQEAIGHPPKVRLLTTKSDRAGQPEKSRGIAFLDVPSSDAMQAALKLHHTQLAGRRINVELTAGGGGKSEARTKKVAERNERVGVQRVRREEKEREAGIKEGVAVEHAPRVWGEAQGKEAIIARAKEGRKPRVTEPPKLEKAPAAAPAPAKASQVAPAPASAPADSTDKPAVAKAADGPSSSTEYQDGMKIRGGRRVKVKGAPQGASALQGRVSWQDRQGGPQRGGPSNRGGKRWEPTGANALSVGS